MMLREDGMVMMTVWPFVWRQPLSYYHFHRSRRRGDDLAGGMATNGMAALSGVLQPVLPSSGGYCLGRA